MTTHHAEYHSWAKAPAVRTAGAALQLALSRPGRRCLRSHLHSLLPNSGRRAAQSHASSAERAMS
eukprot:4687315-Pleurochrysis_carterae.AAC.1